MATPTQEVGGRRSRKVLYGLGALLVTGVTLAGCSGGPADAQDATTPVANAQPETGSATPSSPAPVTVTAVAPAADAKDVAATAPVTVTFSGAVPATAAMPTLDPPVAGKWAKQGSTLTFTPSGGWLPYSTEKVTVPAPAGGPASTTSFTVAAGDRTRLEQMLAELNYLPFTLSGTSLNSEPTDVNAVPTAPESGTLNWTWSSVPATLRAEWAPGKTNVMDQGAVMAFQSDHDLKMDGIAGPEVWKALVAAVAGRQLDKNPYDYLVASETVPETLTVYRDGKVLYTSKANTGVAGATTAQGTFPVYSRFSSTEMKGTNPDGSKYDDKGIPWVAYFNGGDAVHGFVRSSYGFPQSNGCVELPVSDAAQVWKMDPYGTLVTVTK
jgi:lipoprotein-anchoring transpeptidase ErfK/SrfK